MTVKSVVDIDLNEEKFKRFTELYNKYQDALSKQPQQWNDTTAAVDATGEAVNKVLAAFLATGQFHRELAEENEKDNRNLKQKAGLWESIGKTSKGVLKDVESVAKWMLKWGTIGLGAGLAGFFGLRAIAADVSSQRNQALGLDLDVGARDAFARHQGRNLNADAVLQGAFTARSDNSSPAYQALAALGIDPAHKSTVDVANALLLKVQQLAKALPQQQVGYLLQQYNGLSDFGFDRNELEVLRNLSTSELQGQVKAYGPDLAQSRLSDKQAQGFQNFSSSIDQTFASITKQIERDLVPLLPPIEKFVKDVGDTLNRFLRGDVVKKGLDDLAAAIDNFASYMESGAFKKDVDDFSDGVGQIASSFHFLAHPASDTADAVNQGWKLFEDFSERKRKEARGIKEPEFIPDMREHLKQRAEAKAQLQNLTQDPNSYFLKPQPVKVTSHFKLDIKNSTGSNLNLSVNQLNGGVSN